MDFLEDYFYIIILIVGAFAQWLKTRANPEEEGGYEREEHGYDPEVLEEFESEAERMNPRPAVPPPLPQADASLAGVGRSAVPDLRRKSPPPLAGVAIALDAAAEQARQQALMDQAQEFKRAKRARATKEPKKPVVAKAVVMSPAGSIRKRLHSRRELRSAFVLKEILEKPVGLR